MNKQLNKTELKRLSKTVIFTRADKLNRWADVIAKHPNTIYPIWEYERLTERDKAAIPLADTPLGIAFKDPILADAGLKDHTVDGAKKFFEISDHDMHHVVCSCHGSSDQKSVADRIRTIAGMPANHLGGAGGVLGTMIARFS